MKKFKPEYIKSGIFLCIIIGFMFSAVFVYAAKKANDFTSPSDSEEITNEIKIDWEALYPFENKAMKKEEKKEEKPETIFERIYNHVKEKCGYYSSEGLIAYNSIIESAKRYEEFIDWNMASIFEYNPVVKLHDGYLTSYAESRDITKNAESTTELAEFCSEKGIDFFYANLPTKICVSEDRNISGILDFANQNADRFLAMLNDSGVRNYDFRKLLHEDGMNHHEAFFVTDHHWKPETGLWAARHVLRILHDDYGYDVNPDVLNPDRFDYVIYPEWFLGSQGKKVTLARTKPNDFTMIYPKFETRLHYKIPSAGINTSGDFSITYDMKRIESKDYYNKNTYAAYNHADQPLIRTENMRINNGKKILIIHDSVSNCVLPFIALDIQHVLSIDLRHFTGSLKNFIAQEKPDMVIVMYYATVPGRDAGISHSETDKKFYDFR